MPGAFYAGIARRTINPPIGTGKVGFRLFGGPVQAIESNLTATVLVLSNGEAKLAILGLDVSTLGVDRSWYDERPTRAVREQVAATLGIPLAHVMLNASHTHSSAAMPGYVRDTPEELALKERYRRDLIHSLLEAAREADSKLQPARIGVGWGECQIGVYRREFRDGHDVLGEVPGHPVDPSVGVIRIDNLDGNPIAIVFRYSCHPVTVGGRSAVASSDFPGVARDLIERTLGGLSLFMQGAGGNINPTYGIGYEVDCRDIKNRAGIALGGEALKVAASIRTHVRPGARKPLGNIPNILFTPWEPVEGETSAVLGAMEEVLPLEFVELPPLDEAKAIRAEWQQKVSELTEREAPDWQIRVAEAYEGWSRALVDAVEHGHPTCELVIHVLRINDIVIAGINAEMFYETGLAIRARSPFKDTFANGYTNGTTYYLPRAEDYPEGGWDIHASYAVPDLIFQFHHYPAAFHPDSERRVVEATLGLIDKLRGYRTYHE